ncbi:MAG: hypothetical protein AAF296_05045 [Pseudomonadota bacterium]
MMTMRTLRAGLVFDFKRYVRAPSLLLVALATPIAAHFMLPEQDASYAVVTLNDAKPILTSAVIGLELGVLAAILLTPLAYVFLRAGPTRRRPWQISDVTAHARPALSLGRWVADTLALWSLLAGLTIAGLILSVFRIDGEINILQTIIALWLPAAPSLALVAAIRLFLDARNFTRKWLGDVVFVVAWMGLILVSLIAATPISGETVTSQPFSDAFGSISPLVGSVDGPVQGVSIGGSANTGENLSIEAWRAVTDSDYVVSRGMWLLFAVGLAFLAGLIWAPMKVTTATVDHAHSSRLTRFASAILPEKRVAGLQATLTQNSYFQGLTWSHVRLVFRHWIRVVLLVAASIAGFVAPFRTVAGPAILLVLIFPFTEASARWQNRSLQSYLETIGPSAVQRAVVSTLSNCLIAILVTAPAAVRAILSGELQWLPHIAMICFAVPITITILSIFTRSAVAGRMIMLLAWYAYLSSASV